MGLLDKIKGMVSGNKSKAKQGVDAAADQVEKVVPDAHDDKVELLGHGTEPTGDGSASRQGDLDGEGHEDGHAGDEGEDDEGPGAHRAPPFSLH